MDFAPDGEHFRMAHGRALLALMDKPFRRLRTPWLMTMALNMNVTYISPPAKGGRLIAEAKEFNRTNRTAAYDIRVSDAKANLIATCQALVYRLGKTLPFLENDGDLRK